MKKFLVILAIVIVVLIININEDNYYIIPNEAIRFRIIANSNNSNDQYIKLRVKDKIEKELEKSLKNATNIDESRNIIKENIENYKDIVSNTLNEYNYKNDFTIKYGNNYFPEKIYKGVKYEAGNYESLVISLGNANGANWWCVLFPPICNLDFDNKEKTKVEYKFLVKDIFDKYLK